MSRERHWRLRLAPTLAALCLIFAGPAAATDSPATAAARAAFNAASDRHGLGSDQAHEAEIALIHALGDANLLAEEIVHRRHALAVAAARHGPNSPQALVHASTLASVLADAGDFSGALTLVDANLDGARRTWGDADPATVYVKGFKGRVLAKQGRHAEAWPLLQAGYEGMSVLHGPFSIEAYEAGRILREAAVVLVYQSEAQTLRRRLARRPPPDAPEPVILEAADAQLELLVSEKRYTEAVALGEPLVARLTALRGADHPKTVAAQFRLAGAYEGTGRLADAVRAMERYRDAMVRRFGADDREALGAAVLIAGYRIRSPSPPVRAQGRAEAAQAIGRLRQTQGPGSLHALLAAMNLALSILSDPAADPADADRWLEDADRVIAADPGLSRSFMGLAINATIGRRLIDQRRGEPAYGRMRPAAELARARSLDSRVAANGLDAMDQLTKLRRVFVDQIRAGWMYAHEP